MAQDWELSWHDSCVNSLYEEEKQLVYAEKMGLTRKPTPKTPYNFDLDGASVLDIGGGAYSMLLKCVNFSEAVVQDPLMYKYPDWVLSRYKTMGILFDNIKGEDLVEDYGNERLFDECWIYNVLEHCQDPEKVIKNARNLGKIVRIFEWIDTRLGINDGHIHSFTEDQLNSWLGGVGKTEVIRRGGANGRAFFGVFKGEKYASFSS